MYKRQDLEHTRLEVLKSQVNPHFLFNTLNMISCMARLEDAATTDQMIVHLGSLFRHNLRTKRQQITLEEELDAVQTKIAQSEQTGRSIGPVSYTHLLSEGAGNAAGIDWGSYHAKPHLEK